VDCKSVIHLHDLGTLLYFARTRYEDRDRPLTNGLRSIPYVFEHHGSFGVLLEDRTVDRARQYHFYHLAKLYAKGGRNGTRTRALPICASLEGSSINQKLTKDPEIWRCCAKLTPDFNIAATRGIVFPQL